MQTANTLEVDPLDPPKVVAAALAISTQTLANWRCTQRNPLPFVKLGRTVRYRRSVWQAFADNPQPAQRKAAK